MTYEDAILSEIAEWPGVSVEFGKRSKHAQAVLQYRGSTRFVVYPDTPGDVMRGAKNCIVNVRQELRTLGASRAARRERVRTRRDRNRPDRGTLPHIALAPVKADPFAILKTLTFAPPPLPKNRWQRMVGPLRTWFQAILARHTNAPE